MKDKLRILLRIALVLLLVCGVTVGVLYVKHFTHQAEPVGVYPTGYAHE